MNVHEADAATDLIEIIEGGAASRVLILCDHAGRQVPAELGKLGLSDEQLSRHIGWDIGAAAVTRTLAADLGATAILDHCSRLVIDPNRRPRTESSIPAISEDCVVPGNQALDEAEVLRRVQRYFLPYHRTVARRIAAFRQRGIVPAIIAIHSFTPCYAGQDRPWQIGVLWRGDQRLSAPALKGLKARGDLIVGDNQPYSGLREFGFTVTFHAQRPHLPHVMLEIRQDEIASAAGARRYARLAKDVLEGPLAEPSLYSRFTGCNLTPAGGLVSWRHASQVSPLA